MKLVDGKPMWNSDAERTGKPMKPVVHKKGCREMKGWEALDYSRQRYGLTNGDYDRQQHQQQLIKAMAKKATEGGVMTNPLKLNDLMKAAGEAFVLDTGGVPIADFVFTLRGVAANDLVMLRTNERQVQLGQRGVGSAGVAHTDQPGDVQGGQERHSRRIHRGQPERALHQEMSRARLQRRLDG